MRILALVIIVLLAILFTPGRIFLQIGNLTDIVRQVSETGVIALGMTLVILSAGIDLSVGSTLALSTTTVAMLLTRWNPDLGATAHIAVAVAGALVVCAAVGAINGAIIVSMRIVLPSWVSALTKS